MDENTAGSPADETTTNTNAGDGGDARPVEQPWLLDDTTDHPTVVERTQASTPPVAPYPGAHVPADEPVDAVTPEPTPAPDLSATPADGTAPTP
jgi:hypothetical protein